ncbi:MAG: ATP-binding protein [Planctomycetaceae bacterium]|nr:ATP-binding protein [Planctomycetaceae bacterium]
MNIDFNIFDFVDILYIVLLPVAIMVWMTFWLRRQERSQTVILSIWGGFAFIVFVGLTCLLIGIQSARTQWLDYFAEMAAAYSVVVSKLDHWKIVAGDEDVFSEWSDPMEPVPGSEDQHDPTILATHADETSEAPEEYTGGPLAVPEDFSVVRISPTQVFLRWSPVAGATTYRVQWGESTWKDEDWEGVHSGAKCECVIDDTNLNHLFRVRAETGTPEDDPLYLTLMEVCDDAAMASRFIACTYTMRDADEENAMFIVCPATDLNRNDIIEPNERPSPIGELYPKTDPMHYAFSKRKPVINTVPVDDEWGTWVTAFHPILDPDGNFDGVIGLDFHYGLWHGNLTRAKIWPYCFFFILTLLFFGSTSLIVLNQRASEASKKIAAQLQDSVVQLTEAKTAAEAAVRAKGYFLANMSHEIRTPMNAVLGFASIIGRKLMERCRPEEREQCRESVDLITSSGNDLLTIINDILDFSKVDSGQLEVESIPVSPGEILENIHSIMQERLDTRENLTLEFTNDGNIPEFLLSDPTRLRQILNNLIGNAIKFTESGTVSVRYGTKTVSDAEMKADGITSKNRLFVEVRDTGIGISPDQLKRLFQPFSQADSSLTRRFGGTGLGLSISKRLAVLLGGDIQVTSKEGEGSVFTLVLPIREPRAEDMRNRDERQKRLLEYRDSETAEPTDAKPLAGLKVLVVDDGHINQLVISAQLTEAGSDVTLADNGQAAIEIINTNESAGMPFDVVLMDIQMPVMDGYEATRRLRSNGYTRPIIAITAHALSGDCEKTLEVGCDAYLSKPANREQLIHTILETCRKSGIGNRASGIGN